MRSIEDVGEVAERLKAPLSKSGILSKTGSWVRIPPSPPMISDAYLFFMPQANRRLNPYRIYI